MLNDVDSQKNWPIAGGRPQLAQQEKIRYQYPTKNGFSLRYFSLLLLICLVLVGCGSAGAETAVSPTIESNTSAIEPSQEPEAEAPATNVAFPVTIEHVFGSTTIEAAPERVVSIGYADQDALIALGVTPVAARYWFGDTESVIFPWAEDDLQGEEPAVLNMGFGELNYELLLTYEPDVIIAVSSGITADEYELLAQIAPTVPQSGDYDNFGMPWQEATRLIGQAVADLNGYYRGWAGLENGFLQTAERAIWQREGWGWFDQTIQGETLVQDAAEQPAWAEVAVTADGKMGQMTYYARVEVGRHVETIHTTGNEAVYPYPQYTVRWLKKLSPLFLAADRLPRLRRFAV